VVSVVLAERKEAGVVKEQGKRRISPAGRRRMAEAGRVNLERWKAQVPSRASELQRDVDAFRAGLLRDAGPNLTTTRIGLIEAATTTYASIIVVRTKLVHSRRADVTVLTERVAWLTGSLARSLRSLNLDARPRPRSFADLVESKPPEAAAKGSI
jgi:hypothetical protein